MKNGLNNIISVLIICAVYYLFSYFYKLSFFPSIQEIVLRLYEISSDGKLFIESLATLSKIIPAVMLSLPISIALSTILTNRDSIPKQLVKILVILGLTIPVIFWVTVAIISIGIGKIAAIATITLVVTPLMTVTLTEGVKNMRADIDEMAKLFRFSGWIRFRHIVIPQLSPYLIASLRTGISNAWKVALVTEIFGISNGIGYQIILSFYQFSSSLIYAWTIGFTLIILVLDAIMVKLTSLALNRFVRFS